MFGGCNTQVMTEQPYHCTKASHLIFNPHNFQFFMMVVFILVVEMTQLTNDVETHNNACVPGSSFAAQNLNDLFY